MISYLVNFIANLEPYNPMKSLTELAGVISADIPAQVIHKVQKNHYSLDVTLPAEMADKLGLTYGSYVKFSYNPEDNSIVLTKLELD